jgi:hypothetical protein
MGEDGDHARLGGKHLVEVHGRQAADRQQALRCLGVGHRREDLAADGRDAEPGVQRGGEDVRIPLHRLVRDVEVTDEIRPPPDRLADGLRPLGEEELVAIAETAATEGSDRPDPLGAGVLQQLGQLRPRRWCRRPGRWP